MFLLQQVNLILIRGIEIEPVSQLVPLSVYLGLNNFGERGFCEVCLETCLQMCQTQAKTLWSLSSAGGFHWNGLYGLGDWSWSWKLEEKMRWCGPGLPEFGFDARRQALANKTCFSLSFKPVSSGDLVAHIFRGSLNHNGHHITLMLLQPLTNYFCCEITKTNHLK